MSIKKILQSSKFKNKYILKLLIKHSFSFTEEELYKNWDKKISKDILKKIEKNYKDYEEKKIPIEYILGYTHFMGKKIYVDKNTLIPRVETKYLVNYAYNFFKKNKEYKIFDIGTGSGIIGNMLNLLTEQKIICSDISEKALKIAKKNNKNNIYIKSNLGEHLKNYKGNFLICANLPYVEEIFQLDEYVKKEPSTALFSGKDGLTLYRKLLNQLFELDNNIECFFELTKKQGETLIKEYKINGKNLETCHENIKILNFSIKKRGNKSS